MKPARKRLQAIAKGRGRDAKVVVPFAFDFAAKISARPLHEFRTDPTQLANGLLELYRAIGADGIFCAAAAGMELESSTDQRLNADKLAGSGRVAASLEATRRLRATLNDDAALIAALTGPATLSDEFGCELGHASETFTALVKHYCDAGIDVVIVMETAPPSDQATWKSGLRTATNIAQFHRGALLLWEGSEDHAGPVRVPLENPAGQHVGFITTDAQIADTIDVETLRRWVEQVSV